MKSDFFSMISHELRTPLTSIKVGSELLLQESGRQISETQKEILGILSRESQRLIDLVNSILDLAKMEAGVMVFQFKPTNIGPLIQQVVEEFKPLALGTGINLRLEDLTNLPLIKLDAERIKQVIRNFIGNAIKFTPKGGQVTISAFEKGGNLQVCVKDTGPGIPKESLPKIFEKFQQASLQKTSLMKGTGLGLAIAKQIILAHGGKIWAESEAGQGSSFFFALPA
jgi:two-component system sensor histidine kinase GlrK